MSSPREESYLDEDKGVPALPVKDTGLPLEDRAEDAEAVSSLRMRLLLGVMVVLPGVMAEDRFIVRGGGLAKAPAVLAAAAAASDGCCPWCAGVTAFGPPGLRWLPG